MVSERESLIKVVEKRWREYERAPKTDTILGEGQRLYSPELSSLSQVTNTGEGTKEHSTFFSCQEAHSTPEA